MISGICFRGLQIKKTFDMYLSLNTKSPQIFQEDQTTLEQRAAAIFNRYIKQLLTIAAQEKEILNDEAIAGIMVNTRWQTERMLNPQYHILPRCCGVMYLLRLHPMTQSSKALEKTRKSKSYYH